MGPRHSTGTRGSAMWCRSRVEPNVYDRWILRIEPSGNGDVTVTLPLAAGRTRSAGRTGGAGPPDARGRGTAGAGPGGLPVLGPVARQRTRTGTDAAPDDGSNGDRRTACAARSGLATPPRRGRRPRTGPPPPGDPVRLRVRGLRRDLDGHPGNRTGTRRIRTRIHPRLATPENPQRRTPTPTRLRGTAPTKHRATRTGQPTRNPTHRTMVKNRRMDSRGREEPSGRGREL